MSFAGRISHSRNGWIVTMYRIGLVEEGSVVALFDRNGNLSANLRENFATLGVGLLFFILNVCPLGMS